MNKQNSLYLRGGVSLVSLTQRQRCSEEYQRVAGSTGGTGCSTGLLVVPTSFMECIGLELALQGNDRDEIMVGAIKHG